MKWDLAITSPVKRGLRKVPRADLEHINNAFSEMCSEPYSGDVKFLRGMAATFRRPYAHIRFLLILGIDN